MARHYARMGHSVTARRWRGQSGEIDLVFRGPDGLIFTEVKCASTHAIAAERLSERQMWRIMSAASEFVASEADGQDSAMRFDVALVDRRGRIEIIPNALGH